MDEGVEGITQYIHIEQNEFVHRRHKKQKEEDIAICECRYDPSDPESACGERCLNVLTSTECTPGYCLCSEYCRNQRFQRNQFARTKLFKTEGRGCGLLADENIKAGQFVIEYCGEVISWKEAKRRSLTYEKLGQKDAFIISLDTTESIDATRKGSLARFINHSCQPNCETRKWTVLGEVRVGIFAKQDIMAGTELAYDYNFEWYGGAKVRCLCGAASCSGFLGAKSRGFQEDTYLWEDDDDRYSVEKIPLYDSAEDEPTSKLQKTIDINYNNMDGKIDFSINSSLHLESTSIQIHASNSRKIEGSEEKKLNPQEQDPENAFPRKNMAISQVKSKNREGVTKKRSKLFPNGKPKAFLQKPLDVKLVARFLAPKEAQDEVLNYEEMKNEATAELESLYNEIRPAIEEHERDSQDSVATSLAEAWIQASCLKLKSEFDLYSSVIKHMVFTPRRAEPTPEDNNSEVKLLTLDCSSEGRSNLTQSN